MTRRVPPRILILIAQHLHTAPRPQKEALALAKAGYDVTIAGAWHDDTFARRDAQLVEAHAYQLACYADFRPRYPIKRFALRLQSKLARMAWQRQGWFSPALLGYGVKQMHRFARNFAADLTIVHSEGGSGLEISCCTRSGVWGSISRIGFPMTYCLPLVCIGPLNGCGNWSEAYCDSAATA